MINKIIEILSIPILIVNMLGGIIAGIWLAFLGEWILIVIGIVLLFTSHFYLSILMLPGLLFAPIAVRLYEKKNPLGHLFGFLSQFYTNLLIVGTCAFAFFICKRFYDGESKFGLIPYLLWSWGMALGPWQFFQSKEPDNEFSAITLFSATIFYFLFLISIFWGPIFVLIVLALFILVQLLVLPIFNMYLANKMQNTF
jgi:MFS family permease